MNKYRIKTKRFLIVPTDENDIWEGVWSITLRGDEDVLIGTATFAGEKMFGAVPLRVELSEEYRNKKYGTAIFRLMVDFAFRFKNIYEVKAQTEVENDRCRHALEKAGFVHRDFKGDEEFFSITKPKSAWLGLYVYIGIIAGLMIGFVVGSTWVGLVIGIIIGLFVGSAMDLSANKERIQIIGEERSKRNKEHSHRRD